MSWLKIELISFSYDRLGRLNDRTGLDFNCTDKLPDPTFIPEQITLSNLIELEHKIAT